MTHRQYLYWLTELLEPELSVEQQTALARARYMPLQKGEVWEPRKR